MRPLSFLFLGIVCLAAFAPGAAFATGPATINFDPGINPNLPGTNPASSGISGLVSNFYSTALVIAGILAFGAIVWGGIKYAAGRGNPAAESEGKSWITNALLGLLLLAGAYIILYTINPNILNLQLLGLPQVAGPPPPGPPPPGGVPTGCAGARCEYLTNYEIACKPASQQPGGVLSCYAAKGMADTLQCIRLHGAPAFTVTEAMPPTIQHRSRCHNNGCCVDVTVNSGSCADVQALVNAVGVCRATAANEYSACGGTTFETTRGNNVHINSAPGGGC